MTTTEARFRVVVGYDGHRLTWHSTECQTGRNAKRAKLTAYTPEERREAIRAKRGHEPYYTDHMARCCLGRQAQAASPKFSPSAAARLFRKAHVAGIEAGEGTTPAPMVVGEPTIWFGSKIDYSKRTYHEPEGMCGFAWVTIRPGTCSLARQAVALGVGSTAYDGGVSIWVGDHGQSYDRKMKHAAAYAAVLCEAGIDARANGRLD